MQALLFFVLFCLFAPNLAWNIGTEWRNENSFIALKGDGTVQAWGDVSIPPDLSNVRAIYSTILAFAAILKDDGSVRAWGSSAYGATSVPQGLVGVRVISSSRQAFAALKEDGTVETWGTLGYQGLSASSMPAGLAGVRAIYSAEYAFAALKWDGTVQAWGTVSDGGTVPAHLAGVQAIYSTGHAFAALKQDGTVEGWGNNYGGSGVPSGLAGVRDIFSTESAFAALMENGKVQAWGMAGSGGSGVPSDLENVWVIYSTYYAFAALTKEGTVHAWGGEGDGGSGVPQGLTGVREIFSTTHAFAALKRDGSVKVWGKAGYGGTDMPSDLAGVVAISSTNGAFAALTENGTVVTWGHGAYGNSGMPESLTGIRSIYSNSYAFAAITENGTVSAWGVTGKGGSGVPSNLEDVKIIFGTTRYYSDSTAALFYPCPHNTYGPGFPNCTACPQGSNQPIGRPGIRSSIGSCIECGSGKLSFDGTTCQEGCPSGYRLVAGQHNWYGNTLRCMACLPGEYGNSSECLSCPAGRYSDTQGQSSCQQCPVGKISSETKTECTKCPPGKVPSLDASECTSCVAGYFREGPDLDCSLCPPGRFSREAGAAECQNCTVGRYADTWGSPVCDYCPGGKYGTTEEAKSSEDGCAYCSVGHFSFIGSTKCRPSPPGSYVNITGANDSVPCPAGRYQEREGQTGCDIAKSGRYASRGAAVSILCGAGTFSSIPAAPSKESCQACPLGKHSIMNRTSCLSCEKGSYSEDSAGSTVCLPCARGKYLDRAGGNSSLSCLSCPPGTYGDKDRLAECSFCPTGQVQPQVGQTSCIDCSLEGKIKTNNAGHTACIDDKSLMFLSTSVAEVMFTKGLGLGLAFGIAALFMGCAGAIHFMKMGFSATADEDGKLGALATPQVMLKSGLPGFSFGSEVILIMGMVTEQPELGQTMFAFRLLHPCTIFVLVFTIFVSDSAYVPAFLKKAIHDSSLSREFSRRKVPPLCLLLLASICDVTMLQMMPWSDCEFYQESAGYPSLNLMLLCMCVKTVQSLVSVICQMTYLFVNTDLNNPLMSYLAKALFGMSIALSLFSLVMGVMTLLAKWALLKDVKENGRRKSAMVEIENVYKGDGDNCHDEDVNSIVTSTPSFSGKNPMHSDVRDRSKQQGDELEAKNEELRAKDEELRAKDERIRILEAKCRSQLELVL